MDTNDMQKNIQDFYKILPKEGQDYFSSMNWIKQIENIAEKHNLATDEIEGIITETTLVLLGIAKIEDYNTELAVVLRQEDDVKEEQIRSEIYNSVVNPLGENTIRSFFRGEEINNKEVVINNVTETQEVIFENLPQKVQEAINLSGWKKSLFEIVEKSKLNIEQSGIFEDLTIKAIRNEISSDEYRNQILSKLSINEDSVTEIISDVNKKIFQEIRNIMKERGSEKESNPFSSIEDVPIPPYAKKETPVENFTKTEPQKIITGIEDDKIKDSVSSKIAESNIGGIKSVDFSVPQPVADNIKHISTTSHHIVSAKPHDPYREII